MTTDRQRHFFPEDDLNAHIFQRPQKAISTLCIGGPKDGEYIRTGNPPWSELLVTRIRECHVYSENPGPHMRPPTDTHVYRLERPSLNYVYYYYQGLR